MTDAYAERLAALHSGFEAPAGLIAQAARAVTRSPIANLQRIVHGEANEVYGVAFEHGPEVILRIARRDLGIFEKEAWAIGRCRALGVAAPEVLSLQRLEADGQVLEVCILQRLPGERLSDSLSLPRETLRAILRELGEQLSRMHAIGPDDLGEGRALFEADADRFLATEAEFVRLGVEAGLTRQALEGAFRFYAAVTSRFEPSQRRLTHNDLRACHVLAHEGRLSGLIDFGQVSMASPVSEFAKWSFWEEPVLPVAWLQEGYGDKALFDEGYAERFQAFRIADALWVLRWCALTDYPAGVDRAATRLTAYLRELSVA